MTSTGIRIVCISDTHNATPPVEEGDILLHAGDLSNGGTLRELQNQLDWIASLPHKHKVVIGGNHDMLLDPDFVAARGLRFKPGGTADELDWHDIHYLCNESLELELPQGRVRIFGSPNTPAPRGIKGAFQYDPKRTCGRVRCRKRRTSCSFMAHRRDTSTKGVKAALNFCARYGGSSRRLLCLVTFIKEGERRSFRCRRGR